MASRPVQQHCTHKLRAIIASRICRISAFCCNGLRHLDTQGSIKRCRRARFRYPKIVWFPDNINGGSRKKVVDGLSKRGLISISKHNNWFISAAGYEALGIPHRGPIIWALDAVIHTATATSTEPAKNLRTGYNNKQSFKKILGLDITSTNKQGGERVYRIRVATLAR